MKRLARVSGLVLLLGSLEALAQEAAPAAAPPPPDAAAPAPAPKSSGPLPGRWRAGASVGGGTFFPGPMINFGGEIRGGWEFTDMLGVYLTLGRGSGLWLGGGYNNGTVTESISAVGYWEFGVEGELLLGNHFYIALGPKVVDGGWGFLTQSGGTSGASQTAGAVSGWFPGVEGKLGLGFGKPNPETGRRMGFTMYLDALVVFGGGGVKISQSGGTGGASQNVAPLGGVGIAPMLMFGFETR